MDQIDHDYVVLLQPTSPLRTAEDIDATIERCHQTEAPACVTVTETDEPPQWMYTLSDEQRLEPMMDSDEAVTRRQQAPTTYVLNGAVYAARADWLRETKDFVTDRTRAHVMSRERSADVDTALDLAWCEFLQTERKKEEL